MVAGSLRSANPSSRNSQYRYSDALIDA